MYTNILSIFYVRKKINYFLNIEKLRFYKYIKFVNIALFYGEHNDNLKWTTAAQAYLHLAIVPPFNHHVFTSMYLLYAICAYYNVLNVTHIRETNTEYLYR